MRQEELVTLLEEMSLEEKIDQMLQVSGMFYTQDGILTGPANTVGYTEEEIRLAGSVLGTVGAEQLKRIQREYMEQQPHHIPLIFMADIINGFRTVFPIPLAQGCTFDPDLVEEGAAVAARESAAAGLHLTFSPMADLVRDARWGRVMESTGEDSWLNGCLAKKMVEGYQGHHTLKEKGRIAACVKHFAGYGAPMAGRDYNTVELSERTLRDDYLPAYQAAIDAGAATVMTSFNTLDRVPSSANRKLMRDILRKEMGFEGVLISDWAAIEELCNHGIAKDKEEAAQLALDAGVDIDMMTDCYCKHLKKLVESGTVNETLIDEAVFRILKLKNDLGLFENPYKDANETEEKTLALCCAHRKTARQMAAESFVLLKNNGILPLDKQSKIAFIGPYVTNRELYGAWSMFGIPEATITIEEGIRNKECQQVYFAKGCVLSEYFDTLDDLCESAHETKKLLQEAVEQAKKVDKVVLALGEHRLQSGEAASRADITLPACQMELFQKVCAVNKNVVVVLFSGRPLEIREISEKAAAILAVWMPGTEGGNAVADVLFGDINPSGKLSMSFPYSVGQVPIFYGQFRTGRPCVEGSEEKYVSRYLDIPNRPRYPFGYGLSYTTFAIGPVQLGAKRIRRADKLHASVTVKNTGAVSGSEVVQMYLTDVNGSVVRPVRELRGFRRVHLEPGEEREVCFEISEEMLRFHDIHMNYVSEPGEFRVLIGNSSETNNEAMFWLE